MPMFQEENEHGVQPSMQEEPLDVVIVGAGAAGIGCGTLLRQLGITRFWIVERSDIGASFQRWPKETRMITPSFPSNAFGLLDLNAVALDTSPAYSLKTEHPGGPEYAHYLQGLAEYFELPIHLHIDVKSIQRAPQGDGLQLETSQGIIRSRFVIWAAGEYHYPRLTGIGGSELCIYPAQVNSWSELTGDSFLIIGGYESGIDAAIHLANRGKQVQVIDRSATWESEESDPSQTLSIYTQERLRRALATERLQLVAGEEIQRVTRTASGYAAEARSGARFVTPTRPILATGYSGSLHHIADCFQWDHDGQAILTENDEASNMPGLFVSGPMVSHENLIFCFIYKFRQRFAVIAQTIAQRLGKDIDPELIETYRANHMFLDDLSCCDTECGC